MNTRNPEKQDTGKTVAESFAGLALAPLNMIYHSCKATYNYFTNSETRHEPHKTVAFGNIAGTLFLAGFITAMLIPIPGLTAAYTITSMAVGKAIGLGYLGITGSAVAGRLFGAIIGGFWDSRKNIKQINQAMPASLKSERLTCSASSFARTMIRALGIGIFGSGGAEMAKPSKIEESNSRDKQNNNPEYEHSMSHSHSEHYSDALSPDTGPIDDNYFSTEERPKGRP